MYNNIIIVTELRKQICYNYAEWCTSSTMSLITELVSLNLAVTHLSKKDVLLHLWSKFIHISIYQCILLPVSSVIPVCTYIPMYQNLWSMS